MGWSFILYTTQSVIPIIYDGWGGASYIIGMTDSVVFHIISE